jgi:hypothetical protein
MLSDTEVRRAKTKEKPYKLADGRGMYLLVNASGGKLWRMNYRFQEKQKTLAFGAYPVSASRPLAKNAKKRVGCCSGYRPRLA